MGLESGWVYQHVLGRPVLATSYLASHKKPESSLESGYVTLTLTRGHLGGPGIETKTATVISETSGKVCHTLPVLGDGHIALRDQL